MRSKKALAIGIEDYKSMIDKSYYYVDKTLMIKEILDKGGAVNLFTRPRRFGKTLTLSMLRTFFECTTTEKENNIKEEANTQKVTALEEENITKKANAIGFVKSSPYRYFAGMKIMDAGEEYVRHMGQYPVLFFSLKSAKQPNYKLAYTMLKRQIAAEYDRHKYVLSGNVLSDSEKSRYQDILDIKEDETLYIDAIKFLSDCLYKYHQKKTIILIDEYDVPLENAYFRGFYDEMIDFIRSLFESALKTNDNLEFAVITGCLRISRESIFTGLNNLKIVSVLDNSFAECFGFTPPEVEEMLQYYGIEDKINEVRTWYDGYLFGETEVYNPWSVINYVDGIVNNGRRFPKPYWSNTSSNDIIRELVENADMGVKKEIEILVSGGSIEKPVHEEITYDEIYKSQDNLWNFLFFTGYLKAESQRFEEEICYVTMKIPNSEIRYIYRNVIQEWFDRAVKQVDFTRLYHAILNGNCEEIETFVNKQLAGSISYYDHAENFYHGYFLGILSGLEGYYIDSNKEHGDGRPDLILTPVNPKNPAIILEFKLAQKFIQMEEKCEEALEQIERLHYDAELLDIGYLNIMKYGISFCKKNCMVRKKEG